MVLEVSLTCLTFLTADRRIASRLTIDFDFFSLTPLTYAFSNGTDTLTQPNSTISVAVGTDANGNLPLRSRKISGNSGLFVFRASIGSAFEATDEFDGPEERRIRARNHGTWTTVHTAEPGALLLISMGLGRFALGPGKASGNES